MKVITARNVSEAFNYALNSIQVEGTLRSSRNGTVLAFPTPVSTVYAKPTERVLFSPMRKANHAFHLLESLWMLAGRNDTKFPATFVKNMKAFSDDDKTFWGAYGYRWRNFFGWDQIDGAIQELGTNPESRRVVLSMWNAMDGRLYDIDGVTPDFIVGQKGGLDVPCNTHVYLDRRDGKLNMLVACRSNDAIWGCYGANVVHMSILQEFIALSIGCEIGTYTQMSNDLHIYSAKIPEEGLSAMAWDALSSDLYRMEVARPISLFSGTETSNDFMDDVSKLFHEFDTGGVIPAYQADYKTAFFNGTVAEVLMSWAYRTVPEEALRAASRIQAPDWRAAMQVWHNTRNKK